MSKFFKLTVGVDRDDFSVLDWQISDGRFNSKTKD